MIMTTVMLTGVIDGVVKFCDPIGRFRLSETKEEANLYKKKMFQVAVCNYQLVDTGVVEADSFPRPRVVYAEREML